MSWPKTRLIVFDRLILLSNVWIIQAITNSCAWPIGSCASLFRYPCNTGPYSHTCPVPETKPICSILSGGHQEVTIILVLHRLCSLAAT